MKQSIYVLMFLLHIPLEYFLYLLLYMLTSPFIWRARILALGVHTRLRMDAYYLYTEYPGIYASYLQ